MSARKLSLIFLAPGLLFALAPQACAQGSQVDKTTLGTVGAPSGSSSASTNDTSGTSGTSTGTAATTVGSTDTTSSSSSEASSSGSATSSDTGSMPVEKADLPAGVGSDDSAMDDSSVDDATAADDSGGTPVAPDVGGNMGAGGAATDDSADDMAADDMAADDMTADDGAIPGADGGVDDMAATDDMGDAGASEPVSDMECTASQALLDVTDLTIYYSASNSSEMGNISFRFNVQSENLNPEVNMEHVKVRYWYTSEGQEFDWISDNQGTLFRGPNDQKLVTAEYGERSDGEEYIEFSFPDVSLSSVANLNATEVQVRFQPDSYSYDQSDDWSFVASNMQAPNDQMTAYLRGCLVWGTEP